MTLHEIPRSEATELRLPDWSAWSVDVRPRHPVVVTCVEGALLVTLEGDPVDHVVAAGEALTATRRGRLVLTALGPSRVRLQAAGRDARRGREPDAPRAVAGGTARSARLTS